MLTSKPVEVREEPTDYPSRLGGLSVGTPVTLQYAPTTFPPLSPFLSLSLSSHEQGGRTIMRARTRNGRRESGEDPMLGRRRR